MDELLQLLSDALTKCRPDCDYESDEEWESARESRTEALKKFKEFQSSKS